MVVVAILALLFAMLTPALTSALGSGRASHSMSNLRQWGIAVGMYVDDHDEAFPWDGDDNVGASIMSRDWWANALPRYVGMESYRTMVERGEPPVPPKKTIFVDSSAEVPPNAPYKSGGVPFFFCYVPNSKLNSSMRRNAQVKVAHLDKPAATVFMLEMRTHRDELPSSSRFYRKSLDRAKADWQRFSNRHHEGGHIAFADGHVGHVTQAKATTHTAGDYNQDDLIWNPFGEAR
jgi:prepilin-type processing-associated H-X9-DG protein